MRPLFASFALALLFSAAAQADIYRTWDPKTGAVTYTNIKPQTRNYEVVVRERKPEPVEAVPAAYAYRPSALQRNHDALYSSHIEAAARANNLDPALLRAVISVESSHNPHARSPAGAVGLMQLMPQTAQRYGVTNRLDPAQSIHGGARYLRDLLDMFNDNMMLALAGYNAGEEAVMRYGRRIPPFRETMDYVPRVLRAYYRYRGTAPAVAQR